MHCRRLMIFYTGLAPDLGPPSVVMSTVVGQLYGCPEAEIMGLAIHREARLHLLMQSYRDRAAMAVRALPPEELLARSVEELAAGIVADIVPQEIELQIESRHVSTHETTVNFNQGISWGNNARFEAISLHVHIPYTGHGELFNHTPSQMSVQRPEIEHSDDEVTLVITSQDLSLPQVELVISERQTQLINWVQCVNQDVRQVADGVRADVTSSLTARRARLQQAEDVVEALAIPVKQTGTLEIPVRRKTITLASAAAPPSGQQEWRLADITYEQILGTISRFAHALERRPASASGLIPNEETLRDWFMFFLNSNYEDDAGGEIFVVGEAINGIGKTDILVRQHDINAFIGECKFWRGRAAFTEAIDQLLGYTVWRDTKAAMILFITNKNATDVIDKADACIRGHCRFIAAATPDEPNRRRNYTLASPQDEQRVITLALIPVVVPGNLEAAEASSP